MTSVSSMEIYPAHLPLEPLPEPRTYSVYGIRLRSTIPLCLPECPAGSPGADIEIHLAPPEFFSSALNGAPLIEVESGWYSYAHLPGGATYIRYEGLFHFLASPGGKHLYCAELGPCAAESFHAYLLGQALSFALIKQGHEPLHATCVTTGEDSAIAFLGESGYGKSSLAACFLASGSRMVTDDLFLCRRDRGRYMVQPGPPRLKIYPEVADRFLGPGWRATPMYPGSEKLLVSLAPHFRAPGPAPLRAIYVLSYPNGEPLSEGVRIAPLAAKDAFLQLIRGTFNIRLDHPERLQRQFAFAHALAREVPVRELVYEREMSLLSAVRSRILADLEELAP